MADFGMARVVGEKHEVTEAYGNLPGLSPRDLSPKDVKMTALCGTPPWMGPELATNELEVSDTYLTPI